MGTKRRTQVGIIGAGPSGLLLSQLLDLAGIDSIVLERQSRDHVEGRIRAGVLERGTVSALVEAGVGERLQRDGLRHAGFMLSYGAEQHRIDLEGLTGHVVTVYGQTEVTKDLIAARLERGGEIVFEAQDVLPHEITSQRPQLTYQLNGQARGIECDFIAGCDGYHGISRQSIPADQLRTCGRDYPFGWLGVLSATPPVSHELIYATGERGFALCSMRSPSLSRYYVQCPIEDEPAAWSDDRFWDELSQRIGPATAKQLVMGPSISKGMAQLRSLVVEPMRYGNLFLAGDAAHIVPPTGAKGLNLAVADIRVLSRALIEFYKTGNTAHLARYSATCLKRIWKVERFSWYMSNLLHRFPEHGDFDRHMQRAEFDFIAASPAASQAIAENYVGLPLE